MEPTEAAPTPLDLALRQRDAGRIGDAIETLLAAPTSLVDPEVALTLAKMLAESDQLDRAEPWFRHALKLAPDDLFVRMGHGTFLGQAGRHAEAVETLGAVLQELVESLDVAYATEDRDTLVALENLVAATSVNLARSALECGSAIYARELLQPWLAHEHHWTWAHDVLADLIEREGLDPATVAEQGLASGRISPYMACFLIERALDEDPPDLDTVDRVIARANMIFRFDWQRAAPELASAIASARQKLGHAVMRGRLAPDALPNLASAGASARPEPPPTAPPTLTPGAATVDDPTPPAPEPRARS